MIKGLLSTLSTTNHATAIELAALPTHMRGFGHIKHENVEKVKKSEAALLQQYQHPSDSAKTIVLKRVAS